MEGVFEIVQKEEDIWQRHFSVGHILKQEKNERTYFGIFLNIKDILHLPFLGKFKRDLSKNAIFKITSWMTGCCLKMMLALEQEKTSFYVYYI